jgi:hypothetical protein
MRTTSSTSSSSSTALSKLAGALSGDEKLTEEEYSDMLKLLSSAVQHDDARNTVEDAPELVDMEEEEVNTEKGKGEEKRTSLGGEWRSRESFLPSPTHANSSQLVGMAALPLPGEGVVASAVSSSSSSSSSSGSKGRNSSLDRRSVGSSSNEQQQQQQQPLSAAKSTSASNEMLPFDYNTVAKRHRSRYDAAFSAPGRGDVQRLSYTGPAGGGSGSGYSGEKNGSSYSSSSAAAYTPTFKEKASRFYDVAPRTVGHAMQPISIVQRRRRMRQSEGGARSAQTAKKILETLSDLTNPIEEQRNMPVAQRHSNASWSSSKPRESFGGFMQQQQHQHAGVNDNPQYQQSSATKAALTMPASTVATSKPPASGSMSSSKPLYETASMVSQLTTQQPQAQPSGLITAQAPHNQSKEFPLRAPTVDEADGGGLPSFSPQDASIRFKFTAPSFAHTKAAAARAMKALRASSDEISKRQPIRSDGSDEKDKEDAANSGGNGNVSTFAVDGPDADKPKGDTGSVTVDPNSAWAKFMSKKKVFCPFCKVDNEPEAVKCSCDNYLVCPHCDKRNDNCAEEVCEHCGKEFKGAAAARPSFAAFTPSAAPAPVSASAAGSGFTFGSAPAPAVVAPPAGITFGAVAKPVAAPAGITFGATSVPTPASVPATASGGFSFGAAKPAAAPASGGFGLGSPAPAPAPAASGFGGGSSGFSFGPQGGESKPAAVAAAAPASGGFSFGAAAGAGSGGFSASTTTTTTTTTITTGFDAASGGDSKKKRGQDDGSSSSDGLSAKKPALEAPKDAAAAFSFGGSAPAPAPTADAAKPSFVFGASSSAAAAPPTPNPAASSSGFTFGASANASTTTTDAAASFTFGASSAPAPAPAPAAGDSGGNPPKGNSLPAFGAVPPLSISAIKEAGLGGAGSSSSTGTGTGSESPGSAMDMGYASGDNSNNPSLGGGKGTAAANAGGSFSFNSGGAAPAASIGSSGFGGFGGSASSSSFGGGAAAAAPFGSFAAPGALGTGPGIAGGAAAPGSSFSLPLAPAPAPAAGAPFAFGGGPALGAAPAMGGMQQAGGSAFGSSPFGGPAPPAAGGGGGFSLGSSDSGQVRRKVKAKFKQKQ